MENNFGHNLRLLRKKKKETLESLAEILKISKSAISDYETGKTFPSLIVSETIATFFGINTDILQNSNLSELSDSQIEELVITKKLAVNQNLPNAEQETLLKQLEFHNKLLSQQVEGLSIQLQLVKQIVESKESEIRSLLIQVRLLDEKFKRES
ncbi:MAG: helix-turn-helix transcriptional regulator [Bacteroidota bacterium]